MRSSSSPPSRAMPPRRISLCMSAGWTEGPGSSAPRPTKPATYTWTIDPNFVFCGQILTNSVVVQNDITDCAGDGLIIGVAGITVDLNGHVIAGTGTNTGGWTGIGIRNDSFEQVTITNG